MQMPSTDSITVSANVIAWEIVKYTYATEKQVVNSRNRAELIANKFIEIRDAIVQSERLTVEE